LSPRLTCVGQVPALACVGTSFFGLACIWKKTCFTLQPSKPRTSEINKFPSFGKTSSSPKAEAYSPFVVLACVWQELQKLETWHVNIENVWQKGLRVARQISILTCAIRKLERDSQYGKLRSTYIHIKKVLSSQRAVVFHVTTS
jgi:hypothetical protein